MQQPAVNFHERVGYTAGETLGVITTAIVATATEVESGSTFRATCLATEVRKSYTVQRLVNLVSQRRCT